MKRNFEYRGRLTFWVNIMKLFVFGLQSIHSVHVLIQLTCSMRMLRMMSRSLPFGAVVIPVYHPSIPVYHPFIPVYHPFHPGLSSFHPSLSSFHPGLCPETVGLFHTPAPLTTSYRSQPTSCNSWKSRLFERRRSHRPIRSDLTCGFSKSTLSYLELFA